MYATEHPERAATTPDHAAAAEREILERHQRWFEAFERGDRAAMASLAADNFSLVDLRPVRASEARVERTIHDLRVQVTAGVGAVLSGRIAETTTADDAPATSVAMLSEVWIRRGEDWQLVSVRVVPVDAVSGEL
jgi:ketosteroid isomerase-like protein